MINKNLLLGDGTLQRRPMNGEFRLFGYRPVPSKSRRDPERRDGEDDASGSVSPALNSSRRLRSRPTRVLDLQRVVEDADIKSANQVTESS